MRSDGVLPLRPVTKSDRKELSPRQEVEDKRVDWSKRQETLLAIYRASRGPLI
jgi:hypothetical protein